MEPRYWMTGYAALLVVTFLALATRGFVIATGTLAVGVFVVGTTLDAVYVGRRRPDRFKLPRKRLDRVVRKQLVGIALAGLAIAISFKATSFAPLHHASPSVKALIVGAVIVVSTIYVSSLIDWYWIMPKVSGAVGPAPCERPGQERWAAVTNVWFFHRAVATSVVIGVLAAVPAFIAGHSGSNGTEWALLGAALAVGYSSVNTGVRAALSFAFNAPIHVGDIIRVRADPEDDYLQNAYVVDVSIQGLKYTLLERDPGTPPRFSDKGIPLSIEEIPKIRRARNADAPCKNADHCQAVNWYCHRNPLANTTSDPDDRDGKPIA